MGPERKRCKYTTSNSEVLLTIAVPKKLTKSFKNSCKRAPFLVKLQVSGDRISVSLFASSLRYEQEKGKSSAIKYVSLVY